MGAAGDGGWDDGEATSVDEEKTGGGVTGLWPAPLVRAVPMSGASAGGMAGGRTELVLHLVNSTSPEQL